MTVSEIRSLARSQPCNATATRVVLRHDEPTWQIRGRSFDPITDRVDASSTSYFDPTTNLYRNDFVELAFGRQQMSRQLTARTAERLW
jgi:xylulokinase